ncbi:MAG: DUF4124 domain-containing protein [Betaproteobacteria bacterium]|nr:DUF4124 domain-containing protein [Betaproteobacteria bacterium]MBI2958902.1 DUF4124 domain-containing protein [Betaproteobacteria bacterium]
MPRLLLLSALTIAVALPVASFAQVYKCVDPATGKTTYLQSPCPSNTRAATLKKTAPAAPPAPSRGDPAKAGDAKASGPKTTADLERDFRKRRQEQDEARKKEDEKLAQAKMKEENCARARQQLVTLESGVRQGRVDAKGERYFLEDAQVEQEKSRARAAIGQWCK